MVASHNRQVTFIQNEEPLLKSGEYTVTATLTTNQPSPYDSFTESRQFAVAGQRFALGGDQILAVFPPDLATGEFADVLPHVLLSKHTLPWERKSVAGRPDAPWLAVLTFGASELPPTTAVKVRDLANIRLDYGETLDDPCTIIDIPIDVFNRVAPCKDDLPWLAHIREVDTMDSENHVDASLQVAVVVGNRSGPDTEDAYAFLVSLEGLGDDLPDADGNVAPALKDARSVRLVVLRAWRYRATSGARQFKVLVENLNKANGVQQLTTLRLPAAAPAKAEVDQALKHQAAGALGEADAAALTANALAMGYVPLDHRLRHSGNLVSWYRGPLAPYAIPPFIALTQPSSDALARYNPQTGMFDMSYAAAWQLGQLMALQNTGFSIALYAWKQQLKKAEAAQAELDLIRQALTPLPADPDPAPDGDTSPSAPANPRAHAFSQLLNVRRAQVETALAAVPQPVVDWIARLRVLNGVPFAYLVPDERMLPPELLRFFHLDPNWIEALVDGAFSIGRATEDDVKRDAALRARVHGPAMAAARALRRNPRPASISADTGDAITGFLMRSQVLKAWPRLQVNGYRDIDGNTELDKFRLVRLSADILLALFSGELAMVRIHEPPEQLHFGIEGGAVLLRAVVAATVGTPPIALQPGEQVPGDHHLPTDATPPMRGEQGTVKVAAAAALIEDLLRTKLGQDTPGFRFTSAEFALEMIKGVDTIEFRVSADCA